MPMVTYRTDKHQGYTVQHRNYIQYPVIIMESNMKKNIYIDTAESLAVRQKLTEHCKSTILRHNFLKKVEVGVVITLGGLAAGREHRETSMELIICYFLFWVLVTQVCSMCRNL